MFWSAPRDQVCAAGTRAAPDSLAHPTGATQGQCALPGRLRQLTGEDDVPGDVVQLAVAVLI
jgi:hypothetical protein